MATLTPKFDLDDKVLLRAKRAVAAEQGHEPDKVDLQSIPFSKTVETAIDEFEDTILRHLDAAGYRRQDVKRGRPRRVPEELWHRLAAIATEYDTSRIAFVRAALALLSAKAPDDDRADTTAKKRRKRK
ncbi:MAG: hypothetical protein ACOC7Q_02570 [bacterium]